MKSEKKLYHIQGTSDEVERQLAELRDADKDAEEMVAAHNAVAKKELLRGLKYGAVGVVLALICANTSSQDLRDFGFLGFGLAGFVVFVVFAIRAGKAFGEASTSRQGDLDDHRYEGLGRLHSYLKLDGTASTHYDYQLDFRDYKSQEFFERQEPFRNGTSSFYTMPILQARVRLRDGTALRLRIDQKGRVRAYSKTNARGKVKSKYKVKGSFLYQVGLKLPEAVQATALPQVPSSRSMVSGGAKGIKVKINGDKVAASLQVPSNHEPFTVDPILQLAVSTLQRIRHSKDSQG